MKVYRQLHTCQIALLPHDYSLFLFEGNLILILILNRCFGTHGFHLHIFIHYSFKELGLQEFLLFFIFFQLDDHFSSLSTSNPPDAA